jgi:RimJ/RimL family protein N-acetyltransferase
VVGGISLAHVPSPDGSVTLRSELAPSWWGNGYASEAGEALVHWAMHEASVIDVFALVQPDNARAAATAERIGMEWELDLDSGLRVFRIRHGDLDCVDPLDPAGPGTHPSGVRS